MTEAQQQAFLAASGYHASALNYWMRLSVGLLVIVMSVFIIVGLIKLLDDGVIHDKIRFILYLLTLAVTLMLYFAFIVA